MAQQTVNFKEILSQSGPAHRLAQGVLLAVETLEAVVTVEGALPKLIKQKAEMLKDIETTKAEAASNLSKVTDEIAARKANLNDMNGKITAAQSEIGKLEGQTASAGQALRAVEAQAAQQNNENRLVSQSLAAKRKELESLSATVAALEDRETAATRRLQQINADLKKVQAGARALIAEEV